MLYTQNRSSNLFILDNEKHNEERSREKDEVINALL